MQQTESRLDYLLHKYLDDDEAEALRMGMENRNNKNVLVAASAEKLIEIVYNQVRCRQGVIGCFGVLDYIKFIKNEN